MYLHLVTPVIKVKMDQYEVDLFVRNYNLTMRCQPSKTDLHYRWNRKNASLPESAVGVNTSTVTIYRLKPQDTGDYQCIMSNISGVIVSEYTALKINGNLIMVIYNIFLSRATVSLVHIDRTIVTWQLGV